MSFVKIEKRGSDASPSAGGSITYYVSAAVLAGLEANGLTFDSLSSRRRLEVSDFVVINGSLVKSRQPIDRVVDAWVAANGGAEDPTWPGWPAASMEVA